MTIRNNMDKKVDKEQKGDRFQEDAKDELGDNHD
jgi:hypothetical protein